MIAPNPLRFEIVFTLVTEFPDALIGNTKLPAIADLIAMEKNGENLPIYLAILDAVADLAFGSLVLDFAVTPVEQNEDRICAQPVHQCHLATQKVKSILRNALDEVQHG